MIHVLPVQPIPNGMARFKIDRKNIQEAKAMSRLLSILMRARELTVENQLC